MEKNDFGFEIIEMIAVLEESSHGWHKELNLVSWNGAPAKYDIRDWSPDHERMSRGITFDESAFVELKKAMDQFELLSVLKCERKK